jgi:hypothetical protein
MNNLKETMNSCQKVKERYVAFMTESLQILQKNMAPVNATTEFPEITYEMAEKFAMHSLIGNPRILYDFFDKEKMIVEILYNISNNEFNTMLMNGYNREVSSSVGEVKLSSFKTRIEAEMDGFCAAAKELEDAL